MKTDHQLTFFYPFTPNKQIKPRRTHTNIWGGYLRGEVGKIIMYPFNIKLNNLVDRKDFLSF